MLEQKRQIDKKDIGMRTLGKKIDEIRKYLGNNGFEEYAHVNYSDCNPWNTERIGINGVTPEAIVCDRNVISKDQVPYVFDFKTEDFDVELMAYRSKNGAYNLTSTLHMPGKLSDNEKIIEQRFSDYSKVMEDIIMESAVKPKAQSVSKRVKDFLSSELVSYGLAIPLWFGGLVAAECWYQSSQKSVPSQNSAVVSYEEALSQSEYETPTESPRRLDDQSYLEYLSTEKFE